MITLSAVDHFIKMFFEKKKKKKKKNIHLDMRHIFDKILFGTRITYSYILLNIFIQVFAFFSLTIKLYEKRNYLSVIKRIARSLLIFIVTDCNVTNERSLLLYFSNIIITLI